MLLHRSYIFFYLWQWCTFIHIGIYHVVLNLSVKGISHKALGLALVDFEHISIKMLSEWRIISTL